MKSPSIIAGTQTHVNCIRNSLAASKPTEFLFLEQELVYPAVANCCLANLPWTRNVHPITSSGLFQTSDFYHFRMYSIRQKYPADDLCRNNLTAFFNKNVIKIRKNLTIGKKGFFYCLFVSDILMLRFDWARFRSIVEEFGALDQVSHKKRISLFIERDNYVGTDPFRIIRCLTRSSFK